MKFGEPGEIRTPGPLIKSQLRYQLRHRLIYIRRLFCCQQALSPSRRVDFCFMLHQTRNPNVDWATSSLLVCILPITGDEWHILYFLKFLVFFSSAIAYSGEQTKLSIRTSNYEPKCRNLHRLTPNWIRTNISMQLSFYH